MKKYVALSLLAVIALLGFTYFYLHSRSDVSHRHQEAISLLQEAKRLDVSLQKDLLKSYSALLQTYDSIVNGAQALEAACRSLRRANGPLYGQLGPEVDAAIDAYCQEIGNQLTQVELFKSKNAIYRNSLYFMHSLSAGIIARQSHRFGEVDRRSLSEMLVDASLGYGLLATEQARASLSLVLEKAQRSPHPELVTEISHAKKIRDLHAELDKLTVDITDNKTEVLLEKVRAAYFLAYTQAEARANFFRQLLLGSGLLFLLAFLFGITQLWKTALALVDANENLEKKVRERTKALEESQETIMAQQQALISSAKMSALGEMAAGIAHEINNPLAIIKNTSGQMNDLLGDESIDRGMLQKMIERVEKTSDRIAKIVHGLRVFCWNRSDDELHPVKVGKIIEETMSLCSERFRNHDVGLRFEGTGKDVIFLGHETQISQVVLNLLNNAHDAISNLPEKWVQITAAEQGEWLEIRFRDSGPGIPPEVAKKLFQPFFTTKEIGKGTGLGLSISLGIIRKHNGELSLDSSDPHTCFVLRLPKWKEAAPAA